MAKSKAPPKKFQLTRTPYWCDPARPYTHSFRVPEPDRAEKIVEVSSVAELVAVATEFGNEFHGACEVYMSCLSQRTYPNCPWEICCHEDRAHQAPWHTGEGSPRDPAYPEYLKVG